MALKIAIIDANRPKNRGEAPLSVVAKWLEWELERAQYPLSTPEESDIIFLVHSGIVDYRQNCQNALKRYGITINPKACGQRPYIITGGQIDTAPITAFSMADALAVGEAYSLVRHLLDLAALGADINDINAWLTKYPHAITRAQFNVLPRDAKKPYLFLEPPPILASPDARIDWLMPPFISDDGVRRLQASKGCKQKCLFCATSYRQAYQRNPNSDWLVEQASAIKDAKGRSALITNDAGDIPYLNQFRNGDLSFQSMTIRALRDKKQRDWVMGAKLKMARLGVEGVSERLRKFVGKSISNEELFDILRQFNAKKQRLKLFFIAGLPYESDYDWQEYLNLIVEISNIYKRVGVKIKNTAFTPQPPTPLAYFVPGSKMYARWERFHAYALGRISTYYTWIISPRSQKHRANDMRDIWGTRFNNYDDLDLAPTEDIASRCVWEIIDWPIALNKRYKMSRIYKERANHG